MTVRTLTYNISAGGIIPATEQFAGSQGDIKATEIKFILSDELISSLPAIASLLFRFDGYDGEGNVLKVSEFAVEELPESYIPESSTEYIITESLDAAGESQTRSVIEPEGEHEDIFVLVPSESGWLVNSYCEVLWEE